MLVFRCRVSRCPRPVQFAIRLRAHSGHTVARALGAVVLRVNATRFNRRVGTSGAGDSFRNCDPSGIRTFPVRFDDNRGTTRTCIDCRGVPGRLRPVDSFRVSPLHSIEGTAKPACRGNHVASEPAPTSVEELDHAALASARHGEIDRELAVSPPVA